MRAFQGRSTSTACLFLTIALILIGRLAQADPIVRNLVVKSGFAIGLGIDNLVAFNLAGDDFLFPRLAEPGFVGPYTGPYFPGDSIDASSVISGGTDVNSLGNVFFLDGLRIGPTSAVFWLVIQ